MKLNLHQTTIGVELSVKAAAGSRQNELRGVHDGALKVAVTAIAEKGKANQAIVKLLSKELRIPKSRIELVGGATSTTKKFCVLGVELNWLDQRLIELLESK